MLAVISHCGIQPLDSLKRQNYMLKFELKAYNI
jgi:hypothetical protein